MKIEFQAYADDSLVRGELALEGGRLSDFLEGAVDFVIEGATLRALDDGREHRLASAAVAREELCVVVATGPRGSLDRRLRTRPYPVRAEVGPYVVIGYLQAVPAADPRHTALRRQIIALSPATIEFVLAGNRIIENHDALLLVRAKLTLLDTATDDDVGLSTHVKFVSAVDPKAKDLTGEVGVKRSE